MALGKEEKDKNAEKKKGGVKAFEEIEGVG